MKRKYRLHYNPDLNLAVDKPTEISVEEVGECPLCHFASSPTFINGYLICSKENSIPLTAFVILYCTKCKQLYVAKYVSPGGAERFLISYTFPHNISLHTFSDNICSLSPGFCEAYNQALVCECNPLTSGIAGLGYRKALEFLVKDYLIVLKHKDKSTTIQNDLSDCINQLDKDLQDIAFAAAWLGNDEAHYFKKNVNYDIEDLKDFILCLVQDIEREYIRIKANKLRSKKD